jgi:hypothetical protein
VTSATLFLDFWEAVSCLLSESRRSMLHYKIMISNDVMPLVQVVRYGHFIHFTKTKRINISL